MGQLTRTGETSVNQLRDAHGHVLQPYARPIDFDLALLGTALIKRKLLLVLATLAIVVPVAVYSFVTKPIYQSTVALQIEPEAVKVLPYNAVTDPLVKATADFELYMKTQDEILRGPALIARTTERVKEAFGREPLPTLADTFDSGSRIERVSGSQIMKINYVSYDPEFSALAANTIAEEFIRLHFERKLRTSRQASEFLDGELASLKKKVDVAEGQMLRYAQKNSILDTDATKGNVILQRFGFLSSEVSQAQKTLIARQSEYDELSTVTADNFPESLRSPSITSIESRVLTAEQDLSRLLTQFGENWPQVIQKQKELELAQKQLLDEKNAAIARARRDVMIRVNSARGEYESLGARLKEQQQLVNRLNQANVEYNSLKRDADTSDQLYQGLLQRLKETGVSAGLEFGNIHVMDRARANPIPYQPKPAWNISLALLLGLSTGMVLVFYLEYMDRSIRKPGDVEAIGLPLLGWVPIIAGTKTRKRLGARRASMLRISGPDNGKQQSTDVLSTQDMRAKESYRSLLAALLLSKAENPARTILVSSSIAREGKSMTIANLGKALAETGFSTLLIDGDFRSPSLSRRFGVSSGKGLSVFLAGGELDILACEQPKLFILPSGPVPPNPVALLTASRFAETLARLKERFNFILIDSPPVLALADAAIIASKVDGVILVVKASSTPREVVARAHVQLERAGASVLGAALNHVNLRDPEYRSYKKYYFSEKYLQASPVAEIHPS